MLQFSQRLIFSFCLVFMAIQGVSQAKTLNDMISEVGAGSGVPKQLLRYEQGKAEGKGGAGDLYTRGDDSLSFIGLFQRVTDYLALTIASIAVVFMVVNGLRIIYSSGGEELTKAKTGIMWSSLGLAMIMFSYIVIKTTISITYYEAPLTPESVPTLSDDQLKTASDEKRNELDLDTIEAIDIEMSNRGL
ncbi:MAG TPA: hypothetical protein VIT68_01260 [Candidatus Gracilibacteria bacterium]